MECGETNPGVIVGWLPAQVDLLRSPKGDAIWTEIEPNQWAVVVMSLDDFPMPEGQSQRIGDLQVVFAPGNSGVSRESRDGYVRQWSVFMWCELTPNHTFERTARQRGWRVPSRLRRSAAAQRER
jgi:hypothetical protein